jgi:hypothetical protein
VSWHLALIFDGMFDGTEIQGVPKIPWETAPSGDDVNPSLSPPIISLEINTLRCCSQRL